jgi:hypothetical protein
MFAVLGHGYWQTAFGGDADVVGKTVLLNKVPVTIVGVAPEEFPSLDPGVARDSSLLYGVRSADPATFAAAALLLTLVAILACTLPARRAMRVPGSVELAGTQVDRNGIDQAAAPELVRVRADVVAVALQVAIQAGAAIEECPEPP